MRFIKRAQELGFSLAEIRELLSIKIDPRKDCSDGQRLAKVKVIDIEEKIRTLESMKRVLDAAYLAHPERFVKHPPKSKPAPSQVWINKHPSTDQNTF